MSRKQFFTLAGLAVAATLAVWLLVGGRAGHDASTDDALLFPGAAGWVNDVEQLTIEHAGNAVTLARRADNWAVQTLQNYPADWAKVRELLASLAQARVVEQKTDNPSYYDRLGVEDPGEEDAAGVLLTLAHPGGEAALIIGNAASRGTGQYVRLHGAAGSVLIDRELNAPPEALDWAQREIVDIASSVVKEVEIIHPDGDWVRAEKSDPGATDFTLSSLPEGREIASSWTVNSLGGALATLRMDDVLPAAADMPEAVVRFRLLTFEGVEYTVDAWEDEDGPWIQAKASAVVVEPAEDAGETAEADAEAGVEAFNRQVSGWRFQIPQYKFDALTKRSEALLEPLEDDTDTETP